MFTEDDLVLQVQRFQPEGFGADLFLADLLTIPQQECINDRDLLIWDVCQTIPPTGQLVWILNAMEVNTIRGNWDLAFLADSQTSWIIAPNPVLDQKPLRCLELFAGAYGGWKGALEVLSKQGVVSQTVGIEIDERASKAYALSHYACWLGPHVQLPSTWFVENQENWIWQQDVLSTCILRPLACWQPHVVTISAPCPDWSSAGNAHGLLKPGAKLLFQSILLCRWFRPMYIALEQVSNFHSHEHKHWILKALHMVGYRLAWQKVCNLAIHAQTTRLRWLGLAIRMADNVPPIGFDLWPAREQIWPAVTTMLSPHDKLALMINADIVELASSACYLKTSLAQLPTPEIIFAKRVFKPTDVFPTFMALYGRQHLMNREFLKKHGYLGHFVQDDDAPFQCRFLHPAEVALLHGSCGKVYLDHDHQQAWYHLGNMIAIPHALLVLGNLTKALGLLDNGMDEIFQGFHDLKLTPDNSCLRKVSQGVFLMRKDQLLTREFITNAKALELSLHRDSCQVWSPTHGLFDSCESFLTAKSQSISKHVVLRAKDGGSHSFQTETIYTNSGQPHVCQPRIPPEPLSGDTTSVNRIGFCDHDPVNQSALPRNSDMHMMPQFPAVPPPEGKAAETSAHPNHPPETRSDPLVGLDKCAGSHLHDHCNHATNTAATDVPPTPFHAKLSPRLGCESPSPMNAGNRHDGQSHRHQEPITAMTKSALSRNHQLPSNVHSRLHAHTAMEISAITIATPGSMPVGDKLPEVTPCALHRVENPFDPAEMHRAVDDKNPSDDAVNTDATAVAHVPPTLFHAMLPPRLGCGSPSPMNEIGTTPEVYSPAAKRHCAEAPASQSYQVSVDTIPDTVKDSGSSQIKDEEAMHDDQLHQELGPQSPITVASDTQTIPDTIQFQPVLKGSIQWKQYDETFWFAADIPGTHLERVWELGACCQFQDLQQSVTACLCPFQAVLADEMTLSLLPRSCVQVISDGELTLLKVEPNVPMLQQPHITMLANELYDQFGSLAQGQTTDYGTLLFTEPLTHGVNTQNILMVLAAFSQSSMKWHVCRFTNRIVANFSGEDIACSFLRQFFRNALTEHSLEVLGRKAFVNPQDELVFEPQRNSGVAPPNSFLIAVAIASARTLLDGLEAEDEDRNCKMITLKWAGRPVWKGRIQGTTTLATLECIMRYCLAPWGHAPAFRMVCHGGQVPLERTIEQLPNETKRDSLVIHAVMALKGGGQGTKVQQRAIQQNALASTLLDHGFNLTWTTKTVETIMDKFGLGKLQAVNAQPMGSAKIQAVLQLCKEAGVTIPELAKPKSGNEIPGSASQKKKRRALDFKLNPADYTLVENFFSKEDGSKLPQVSQILPQACGICLQTAAQAEVWIREGQKISVDELGLLVLGPINVHCDLTSEEITFPCFNTDRQMVLITATLVQLGAKTIKHREGDPKQVPSETCSLVAVTMYKDDWQEEDWHAITANPAAIVRKRFESEGLSQGIQAVWGKSLRHNRSPATPLQAMTVQVHMTVEDAMLERLLARSGFNRLFLTPKTQGGKLNASYKVIWIPGDIPKVTSLSTKCQSCVGLVRGR